MTDYHTPVMVEQVLSYLQPHSGGVYVDCTVGGGGHALEIVKRILPDGRLLGLDRDEEALRAAAENLEEYSENVTLVKGNFSDVGAIAQGCGVQSSDGIFLDLGVSARQILVSERGFSILHDGPLDMRMDAEEPLTARDLVNSLSEGELADLIWKYGEERWAKRIAGFIVERRSERPIETTGELADIVAAAIPMSARPKKIHPATRTFMSLRLVVNHELESLEVGLQSAIGLLRSGGRVCVLSYHSLEDRIVKQSFSRHAGRCICPPGLPACLCDAKKTVSVLTRRPLVPSEDEVLSNTKARSAKLRVAEKI